MPLPATAAPQALAAAAAVGSGIKYAREDHVHAMPGMGVPVTRTLAFATAYQPTTVTKAAFVTIIIDCTATATLLSAQANTVELIIGAANTVAGGTGTLADTFRSDLSVSIVLSLGWTGRQALKAVIPAGWYFAVRRTVGTGMTIVSAHDQTIG